MAPQYLVTRPLMPPLESEQLPGSLLARIQADSPTEQMARALRLLSPLSL